MNVRPHPAFCAILLILTLAPIPGCGERASVLDATDYLCRGGTFEETVLFDGVRIGQQKTTFTVGENGELQVALSSRIDGEDGSEQETESISRYDTSGVFLGAEGTIWNRKTGLTAEFSTPEGTTDGPAAVAISLLKKPLRPGEKRTVAFSDLFQQPPTTVAMAAHGFVKSGPATLLYISATLTCGEISQPVRLYVDANGNIIQTDLVVNDRTLTIHRTRGE